MIDRVLVCVASLAVSSVQGATIHVDAANCPGPGDGSAGNPFCSLADGIAAAVSGDVVELAPGTYSTTGQVFIDIGVDITLRGTGGYEVTEVTTTHIEAALVVLSDSLVEGITFRDGDSSFNAGIVATSVGDPTFRNCRFTANSAAAGAGAVAVTNGSATRFENCLFDGNRAHGGEGGAVRCFSGAGDTRFVNCTFAANTASVSGGAVFCDAPATVIIENCIVAGNGPDELAESASGLITVSRSLVQGGWDGTAVMNALPDFVDAVTGDYRLGRASPAIDAGDNALVAAGVTSDPDGNPRFDDDAGMPDNGAGTPPLVDLGAFERHEETEPRTYYIAPDGDDANDGLSPGAAWQSWAQGFRELRPGDTLIVRDGTWAKGGAPPGDPEPVLVTNRLAYLNCDPALTPDPDLGVPYRNGVPGLPITVRAENERRAFLRSDGSRASIEGRNCSHWTFEGLRGEGADLAEAAGGEKRSIFMFFDPERVVLRRMLGAKNNRYFNTHIFEIIRGLDCLLEENEAYDFHRHGFSTVGSRRITFTRNYAHSRGRADIPGGYESHTDDFGDEGLVCYFSHECLVQNTIVEDSEGIQATGDDNVFLGSIAIGGWFGFRFAANCQDEGAQMCEYDEHYPTGNSGAHLLSVGASLAAMDFDGSGDSYVTNLTAIGVSVWDVIGRDRLDTEGFDTSFQIDYSLAVHTNDPPEPGSGGFLSDGSVDDAWGGTNLNSYGHFGNYSPNLCNDNGCWTNVFEIDPQLGDCLVFIPEGSPMHTVADQTIGATILHRYEDGVLTDEPLWDPVTGAFPCGAIVDGVNGPNDGERCANVHERLNVNFGGCTLPGQCPADLDGNGEVGFADLLAVLSSWGPCAGCTEDLDGNGDVGFTDLLAILSSWGPC